jgi:hypothetical protein
MDYCTMLVKASQGSGDKAGCLICVAATQSWPAATMVSSQLIEVSLTWPESITCVPPELADKF